jgi:hypothetical protein
MFWYPFPDLCLDTILSRSSTDNSTSRLGFAPTCIVHCGTLYRQVCAFPNHVQWIEFTTGGLQSSCRNILRMINGNRMYLSSISSLIAKGLNTYVNKVCFNFFYKFPKMSKNLFMFCHIGDVCRFIRGKTIKSILEQGCNVTKCGKSQGCLNTIQMHCIWTS